MWGGGDEGMNESTGCVANGGTGQRSVTGREKRRNKTAI